jgi:hypothetical protein
MEVFCMSEKFLKLHSIELVEKYQNKLSDFFRLGAGGVSNVNQYIKNGEKNAILDDSSVMGANISFDEMGRLSLTEELQFASPAHEDLFNPLNSSEISDESMDFIKSCYPEYYSISKKDSFLYRHENECCILPEAGKCFYIRSGQTDVKYKASDIFPRQIGFAYDLEENRRIYKGFGYHKFKENSEEIRFEGLEILAEPDGGRFLARLDSDFGRILINLVDVPEDCFVYMPLGDIIKEQNRVRIFNWSGNRA